MSPEFSKKKNKYINSTAPRKHEASVVPQQIDAVTLAEEYKQIIHEIEPENRGNDQLAEIYHGMDNSFISAQNWRSWWIRSYKTRSYTCRVFVYAI